jgi:hypothetical protein
VWWLNPPPLHPSHPRRKAALAERIKHYATSITQTRRDLDTLADSLPNIRVSRAQQDSDLAVLEAESRAAAEKLRVALASSQQRLAQIRDALKIVTDTHYQLQKVETPASFQTPLPVHSSHAQHQHQPPLDGPESSLDDPRPRWVLEQVACSLTLALALILSLSLALILSLSHAHTLSPKHSRTHTHTSTPALARSNKKARL